MHYRPQQMYYTPNEYAYETQNSYFGPISLTNIGIASGSNSLSRTSNRITSNIGHRRNNSSTCSNSSINHSCRTEDEDYNYSTSLQSHPARQLEYSPSTIRHDGYSFSRQNSSEAERPFTLEVNTKLRSSLKKYGYNRGNSPKINSNNSSSSGAGTPTNPTPPDSLTSEDSSYVSAKEGSVSRVRFSPIAALMCEMNPQREGVLDVGLHEDSVSVQSRRARKPSASELEKDFTS